MRTMTLMQEAMFLLAEANRRQTATASPALERFRQDPARLLEDAGLTPDPWQRKLLCSNSQRSLLLCSRQSGKSTVAAALALQAALLEAPALVLLLSPTQRQSGELLLKTLDLYRALGRPVPTVRPRDAALKMELANGSRILSLPAGEATVRGYSSVRLLIVDEASRVMDDLYMAIRPMLSVSQGRMVALSTPFGKRGWFHAEWSDLSRPWNRVEITADQCPRISREFLTREEKDLGPRWFRQEYLCSFEDSVDGVFLESDILAAFADDLKPLMVKR